MRGAADRHGVDEPDQSVLGRRIGDDPRLAGQAPDRAHVDHAALASRNTGMTAFEILNAPVRLTPITSAQSSLLAVSTVP